MMKTFEAMLAAVLIITVIVMLSMPAYKAKTKYAEVRRACERALLSMSDKDDFRALVLNAKDESSLEPVKTYVDEYIEFPFELQICDENNNCVGSKPSVENYLTVTYLMDGNITDYNILEIRLYVWIFPSE
ncbi:MAG: hypothetical protein J7L44_03450 [Candidatus Diapherotrites archaeon]|nr:hypothetical protein [Candidatus Diapherotrites archaeon]